jgi:hypothetical protein
VNANLFEGFVVNTAWKVNPDLPKLFLELGRHWYPKLSVFDGQSWYFCFVPASRPSTRDYQQEVAICRQILRKLYPLLVTSLSHCTNQPIEALKCSVYHLQCLLSDISIKQLIVLVNLALVIVGLIAQMLAFLKEVWPNRVKPYVLEIFAQSAQLSQSQEFGLIQFAHLVFLSQEHRHCFATAVIIQRDGRF